MGVSQSKTSVDVVNNSIINCITNNLNACSASSTQSQQVSFSGFGLFDSATQSATINLSCLQKLTMTNSLSTAIAQQIQQDAEAQSIALLPSYSGASNSTNLSNYITTNITTNNIQQCATNAIQSQNLTFSGIQIGVSATQTLSLFTTCLQTVLNNNSIAQNIVQNTAQQASATNQNPLSFLTSAFSLLIIALIAIIIVIVTIAYVLT